MIEGDPNLLPAGTQIGGSFVVDTAAPPAAPSPARLDEGVTKAIYDFTIEATLDIPGFAFGPPASLPYSYFLRVYDNHECTEAQVNANQCFPERTAPTDELDFGIGADLFDAASGWEADIGVHIEEWGADPTLTQSLSIPIVAPELTTGSGGGGLLLSNADLGEHYYALLTSVTFSSHVVPEPSRVALLSVLAIAWLALRGQANETGRPTRGCS